MKGDTLFSIILSFNRKYNFLFEVYNIRYNNCASATFVTRKNYKPGPVNLSF